MLLPFPNLFADYKRRRRDISERAAVDEARFYPVA